MYQQHGIRCSRCGDEIYSNSVHDWESCLCGGVFIDGGWQYRRVGWEDAVTASSVSRMVERKGEYRYFSEEPERLKKLAGVG